MTNRVGTDTYHGTPVGLSRLAKATAAMGVWASRAACKNIDPDLFFPGRGDSIEEPVAVCRGCEVRAECLEYALDANEMWGIWGGTSERERRRIRRRRALDKRHREAVA